MSGTAIVTGGSTGIGAAIVRTMLDRGYEVVSLSRRRPAIADPRLDAITVDLYDAEATRQVADEIAKKHAVTHIVHNAGVTRHKPVEQATVADIDALAQLHLGAVLTLLQATLPSMKAGGFGRVILISSRAALGVVGRTAYSATKAGMIGMGRTWALELAPLGITVNMVAPGPIGATEMFHDVIPAGSEREKTLANAIPVKRLGTPADVANAVMFFASRDSGFVTGQVLYVCGGASVGTIIL
ncbi:MAG TPA: SDR family oxidoreductase [Stellaceae bacterium]